MFDARMNLIGVHEISSGALTAAMVDPRVVFAAAVVAGASALILVHTHPSGDPQPSTEDVMLTDQIGKGAKLLSIRLLDHLIVARGGAWYSLRSRGHSAAFGGLGDLLLVPPSRFRYRPR
jgi:DNA repair protein RadC